MSFYYRHPKVKVSFGRGERSWAGKLASKHGERALVVTGKSAMERLGFLEELYDSLEENGVEVVHSFNDIRPNPEVRDAENCARSVWDDDIDVIVALGGGSVMDTAKGVNVALSNWDSPDEGLWEYVSGETRIEEYNLPLVAITTTSGTGSHVNTGAVLANDEINAKPAFGHTDMAPDNAIVDPEIMDHLPPEVTAASGFDVFAHASEGYVAGGEHPISDLYSIEAMEKVANSLVAAVNNPTEEARDEMALADTLAGEALASNGTVLNHALAHSISGHDPDVAHGQALATITPAVIRYNVENGDERTRQRYSDIARILGKDIDGGGRKDALKAAEAVEELRAEIGLDRRIDDFDVSKDEIDDMVSEAKTWLKGAWNHNPVEVTDDDAKAIYDEAW